MAGTSGQAGSSNRVTAESSSTALSSTDARQQHMQPQHGIDTSTGLPGLPERFLVSPRSWQLVLSTQHGFVTGPAPSSRHYLGLEPS